MDKRMINVLVFLYMVVYTSMVFVILFSIYPYVFNYFLDRKDIFSSLLLLLYLLFVLYTPYKVAEYIYVLFVERGGYSKY